MHKRVEFRDARLVLRFSQRIYQCRLLLPLLRVLQPTAESSVFAVGFGS